MKQDGVRRCRVRPSTWGSRELQPPGRTASTAMDHIGREDQRQSRGLLQCEETSLHPACNSTRERKRRKGRGEEHQGLEVMVQPAP